MEWALSQNSRQLGIKMFFRHSGAPPIGEPGIHNHEASGEESLCHVEKAKLWIPVLAKTLGRNDGYRHSFVSGPSAPYTGSLFGGGTFGIAARPFSCSPFLPARRPYSPAGG